MTDITPPPELVQQWVEEANEYVEQEEYAFANRAAQWGADQELEACCKWFQDFYKLEFWMPRDLKHLRAARRPSLKKQALQVLGSPIMSGESRLIGHRDHDLLRRVLEALPDND